MNTPSKRYITTTSPGCIESVEKVLDGIIKHASERENGDVIVKTVKQHILFLIQNKMDPRQFVSRIDSIFANNSIQPQLICNLDAALPFIRNGVNKGQYRHLLPDQPTARFNRDLPPSLMPEFGQPKNPRRRTMNTLSPNVSVMSVGRQTNMAQSIPSTTSMQLSQPPQLQPLTVNTVPVVITNPMNRTPANNIPRKSTKIGEDVVEITPLGTNQFVSPVLDPHMSELRDKEDQSPVAINFSATSEDIDVNKIDTWVDPEIVKNIASKNGLEIEDKEINNVLTFISELLESRTRMLIIDIEKHIELKRKPPAGTFEIKREPLKELKSLDKYYRLRDSVFNMDLQEHAQAEARAASKRIEEERKRAETDAAVFAALGRKPKFTYEKNEAQVHHRDQRVTMSDIMTVFSNNLYIQRSDVFKQLHIHVPSSKH